MLIHLDTLPAGLLCMGSIISLFAGLAVIINSRSTALADRFSHYVQRKDKPDIVQAARIQHAESSLTKKLADELARRGAHGGLALQLAEADLKLTPSEFIIVRITSAIAFFGLGLIVFKVLFVALPTSVVGYFLPVWYLGSRRTQRHSAFSAQLPNALTLISNSMRSGYSLPQSLELVSKEMKPPVSEEFGRIVREIGLGLSMEAALNNALRRMPNDDLELIVTAILVQYEVGGNLTEVLDIIGHTARERIRIKGEIKVLSSQQSFSGYFVGLMPIALSVLLFIFNPAYMSQIFDSTCGLVMFGSSFLLIGLAMFIIRKIVAIKI